LAFHQNALQFLQSGLNFALQLRPGKKRTQDRTTNARQLDGRFTHASSLLIAIGFPMDTPKTHASGKITPVKHVAKTRVLLLEEQPLLRYGVSVYLNLQPDMMVCGTFFTSIHITP
jgi:hypothetical protein